MEVIFLSSFKKDIKNIKDRTLKQEIKEVILSLEKAYDINNVKDVKKLKGFATAYRFKIKNYRLGFYCSENVVEVARFVKRNDIYKIFPKKGIK